MKQKTEIYQLCPNAGFLMHSYLIKTPNNKIVVIDGGHTYYMRKAYLPHVIRAILGLNVNDYFEIEALFLSHAHIDHYGEFIMMMREYDEQSSYKINNIYFDFPDFLNSKFDERDYELEKLEMLKEAFEKYASVNRINVDGIYFDYLNGRSINAKAVEKGLSFNIDGVVFEILQTWSENDDIVNGNSLIIKVYDSVNGGKTCIFLNDASVGSGARLLSKYEKKLKSDIVQIAHHGQAGVNKDVYSAIDASIRLWPTPFWVWNNHDCYKTDEVRSWFGIGENNYTKNDMIACRYSAYPEEPTCVDAWKKCVGMMKVTL